MSATQRVLDARSRLMFSAPFYSVLARRLQIVETVSVRGMPVDTYATDGAALYVNPAFDAGLSRDERAAVLAHEVEHCASGDHRRRGTRNPERWNVATDIRINGRLRRQGFKLPADAIFRSDLEQLSAERIYAVLERGAADAAKEAQAKADAGDPGDEPGEFGDSEGDPGDEPGEFGDSEGDPGDEPGESGDSEGDPGDEPGESGDSAQAGQDGSAQPAPARRNQTFGEVLDYPGDSFEADNDAKDWEIAVAQAGMIAQAHEKSAGRGAGTIAETVSDSAVAVVPWRQKTRQFARDCQIRDVDWTRRSRRSHGAGFIWPGQRAIGPSHAVLVIDTSGSMDTAALASAMAEAQSMLDNRAVERMTLIDCDDNVNAIYEYSAGDIIGAQFFGRGGTSYHPAWRWIEENAADVCCVIYLTDMQPADGFGEFNAAPVLWAVPAAPPAYRPYRTAPQAPPFGEIVEIDPWQ